MPPTPIKATAHGLIDWVFVTLMFGAPVALGVNARLRTMSWVTGASMGALNAITDHPVAVKRLISLGTHGWIERASVPAAIALPLKLGAVRDAKDRGLWLSLLTVTLTTHVLTDWSATPDS
jgi:hypothetical protein